MKIVTIYLSYLRAEAHYQFMLLVQKLVNLSPRVTSITGDLLPSFNNLLVLEGKLVDAVKASEYTGLLVEANRRVDRAIVSVNKTIESGMHHFDPEILKAARLLNTRVKAFRGSIGKKSYEEESAAVKILVADLETTHVEQVTLLALEERVRELAAARAEFETLFIARNAELAARPPEKLVDVKKQVNAVYRRVIGRVDSYNVLNPTDTSCLPFVKELNREIAYFNEHNHHHARINIATAVVKSIPDQPYAGEPVIVLPDVMHAGKKLVFTRDYELSYKANDNPGTATVTIRGKGTFKGKKPVTFNVIAPTT
jgi:hypothetical protein